jgi:zinc finger CCHC domain-containing protein 8
LDDEQKFAAFVPGQISSKLRKALGLAKHQLPKHIYKMRTLGYPPGWMEDARISHSGLTLYDSQGKGKYFRVSSRKLVSFVEVKLG